MRRSSRLETGADSSGDGGACLAILGCVARGDLPAARLRLAAPSLDAEGLAAFAASHQVAGFLHATLEPLPEYRLLSAAARDRLASAYLRQWATNERLAAEVARLARTFDAAGVNFILLKGHHSALRFYGNVDRRGISDLDILVRPGDRGRARAVLEGRGFRLASRMLVSEASTAWFVHAFEFVGDAACVDLHWEIASHPSFRIDYEALWAGANPFEVAGASVLALDDEYALLVGLLGAAKDLELGTLRLKAFVDLARIVDVVDGATDWDAFLERRGRERVGRACTSMLALLLELFDAWERFPRLAGALRVRPGAPAPRDVRERAVRTSRSRTSLRSRLWAASLYETPLVGALSWWAVSLPFRLAVYRHASAGGGARP
jgi:hypothetical protein